MADAGSGADEGGRCQETRLPAGATTCWRSWSCSWNTWWWFGTSRRRSFGSSRRWSTGSFEHAVTWLLRSGWKRVPVSSWRLGHESLSRWCFRGSTTWGDEEPGTSAGGAIRDGRKWCESLLEWTSAEKCAWTGSWRQSESLATRSYVAGCGFNEWWTSTLRDSWRIESAWCWRDWWDEKESDHGAWGEVEAGSW